MKKILLIEDEPSSNQAYQKKLEGKYELKFITQANVAHSTAKSWQPDLIILDIILPGGLNGFDILKKLKQDQLTKHIKVIVLTNLTDEKKNAVSEGAIDCRVKAEISLEEIENLIIKHLD
jgi:CheY-like chemotaxis protein